MTRKRNDGKEPRNVVIGRAVFKTKIRLLSYILDDLDDVGILTLKDAGRIIMRSSKELYNFGASLTGETAEGLPERRKGARR